ncbi:Pr6Pr family membrane protein [Williamsia sp. CHRR-6]|uniref:Pr6Pr family membrane protein n=1 Tax=Williamsia sp. CHRR-6 TaxID=2835871 RepID=UPI001BDA5518|nr:Pr6Pr family membrane protein [Williamsia sp. CHRR-6]MBT0568283.1 Pr6Pr family membrane protein [Williamsia sp. CHRR-6]
MRARTTWLIGFRLLAGLAGPAAVITEVVVLVHRGTFDAGNFLSYFTIQSNILGGATLLITAAAPSNTTWLPQLRGAATTYLATTGIVFATLLAGIENATFTTVPWDNVMLHYVMPVVMVVDWLLDPPASPPRLPNALWWLAYPLAYVAYSLIRGPIVDWYPYPFLNPSSHGYLGVAIAGTGVAAMILALTWLITWLPNHLPARSVTR